MPKYYCDYCDTFLTHDSPSVRKTHNGGRKHKENVRNFYQKWMDDQAQKLVDATAKAFAANRAAPQVAPGVLQAMQGRGGMIPPSLGLRGAPPLGMPPFFGRGAPMPNPFMMRGAPGAVPQMPMGMRPPTLPPAGLPGGLPPAGIPASNTPPQ